MYSSKDKKRLFTQHTLLNTTYCTVREAHNEYDTVLCLKNLNSLLEDLKFFRALNAINGWHFSKRGTYKQQQMPCFFLNVETCKCKKINKL